MTQNDYSFDWTIAPETPETFFGEYFEKKPMVVRRNDPEYYGDLLTYEDIDRVITTMGLHHPEINVTKAGGSITPEDFVYESGLVDPVRVNQLFDDGATVILSGLHDRLPKLARYCRALEQVMSCRVQTNIYMTQAQTQGFKAHYDNHDVVVLQLSGTKEWRIYDTPVELPLNSQAFNPHDVEIGEETDRFLLHPGDMLYVPRGLAHDAVATGEPSLHITTGLMLHTWADLMVEAVQVMAHDDAAFRRALPPGFASAGFDASAHAGTFDALVKRLGEAPLAKLLASFKMEFLMNRMPRVEGQMAQLAKLDGLTAEAQVGARPHVIYDLAHLEEDGQVRLVAQGTEVIMPDFAREALEYAITTPAFRIADMPGELDDAGKVVLVKRLVREGLMVVH
ncbi:cupin domain-containing protein [Maritalea mobilis]|uniref:cupin domain-containing protein n=1 Tax=Maritalea mobilis TaxID=483324 RepID=UPI001C95DF02|nr:cupin domain-containing protein [Maritalea mobilis]MBY6202935.1 cupin domain-containing protein [Maritalea mobilis]